MADGGFDIRSVIHQVKRAFQGLTTLQKSMVVAITAVLLVALTAPLVTWASRPEEMGVLAADLTPVDASTIVEDLKKQGVRHELSPDQTRIMVPQKLVGQLKLRIAGESILGSDRLGWDKLESPGLTTTDFSQRTMARRAKEAELSKILREGMPNLVTWATVQITPAKDSVFVAEKEDAKASVMLRLRSKGLPPEESIQAVMNLLAYSVEGLKPENVVVADQFARILSKRDSQAKVTDAQRKMQREEEDYLVGKVKEQLEPAVGIGKVMASARVELDFDKVLINEETFDPQGQVERAVETEEEKIVRREPPMGIPGTPTNVAPADAEEQAGGIIETKDRKKATTNYEISNTRRAIEKSPGSIKRVSISVLLDQKTTYELNAKGHHELRPVAWTQEELDKFRNLVVGSAGIDSARGDVVTVDSLSFAPTIDLVEEDAARRQRLMDLIKILAPFAIILLTLIGWGIYKFATRPRPEPEPEPEPDLEEEEIEEEEIEEEEEEEEEVEEEEPPPPPTVEEVKRQMAQAVIDETESPEAVRREAMKQQITELVVTDPENAASLVRTWLLDDSGAKK